MAVTGLIFIAIATPIIFGWLIYQAYKSRPIPGEEDPREKGSEVWE